jgi:hypothetical protein
MTLHWDFVTYHEPLAMFLNESNKQQEARAKIHAVLLHHGTSCILTPYTTSGTTSSVSWRICFVSLQQSHCSTAEKTST